MVYLREKLEKTNWRIPYDEKEKQSPSWVPAGIGGSGSDRDGAVPYPVGLSSTVNIK